MDPRRPAQHEYARSRGGDGGGYGAIPSSSGRAIPPTAVPSLSTGQGFYTVESLQGATMVPPPQPAPPPPRFLARLGPQSRDLPFPPLDRRYPPPAAFGRKMMMAPPNMPMAFMGDPRIPGFHPGRFGLHNRWGPGALGRHAFDRSRDRTWASQRIMVKKQGQRLGKPFSQSKDKKSLADKQNAGEGGPGWCALCKVDCSNAESLKMHISGRRHKKQVESQTQVDGSSDKKEEAKEGGVMATASELSKDYEVNDEMASEGFEEADDLAPEGMVVDASKGEDNSQTLDAKSVAGRKRVLKDTEEPNKRPCKSAALSSANNALAAISAKGLENVTNGNEIQKTSDSEVAEETIPDAHIKAANNESQTSSTSLKVKGEDAELLTAEKELIPGSVDECVNGAKEVRNVLNLANGSAGQSAEIQ